MLAALYEVKLTSFGLGAFLVGLFALAGFVAAIVLLVLWLTRKERDAEVGRREDRP